MHGKSFDGFANMTHRHLNGSGDCAQKEAVDRKGERKREERGAVVSPKKPGLAKSAAQMGGRHVALPVVN